MSVCCQHPSVPQVGVLICSLAAVSAVLQLQAACSCSVSRLQRGTRGPLTSPDSIIITGVSAPCHLNLIFFIKFPSFGAFLPLSSIHLFVKLTTQRPSSRVAAEAPLSDANIRTNRPLELLSCKPDQTRGEGEHHNDLVIRNVQTCRSQETFSR